MKIEYDSQEELDDAADYYEELCFEHQGLQDAVEQAENDLYFAQQELEDFEDEHPEIP